MISLQNGRITKIVVLITLLILSLIPVYLINYRAIKSSYHHYWGINYYLNNMKELSYKYWRTSLDTPNPYLDGSRVDFGTTIQDGYQLGIVYDPISQVHKEVIEEMKKAIQSQPENYFFYTFLAEFYNIFSDFDPSYLDEAEKLENIAWQLSPNRQQILYAMAKTALLKGDEVRGYEAFKKAVDLNPLASDPHFFFGLVALSRQDMELGLSEIALAEKLGRRPRNFQEAISLGNLVGDAGNYKKAIETYQFALKQFAEDPNYKIWSMDVRLKLAIAYYLDGNQAASKEAFLSLMQEVNLKQFPIYKDLRPILDGLGIP